MRLRHRTPIASLFIKDGKLFNELRRGDDDRKMCIRDRAMEAAGVDAAIVSDLGVMSVVQQHAPSVAIHVSTQASVSNAEAALMWYRLGVRRVVCAREMSVLSLIHI